jgi:hypothetical protein
MYIVQLIPWDLEVNGLQAGDRSTFQKIFLPKIKTNL